MRTISTLALLACSAGCPDAADADPVICSFGESDGSALGDEQFSTDEELATLSHCELIAGDLGIRDDVTSLLPLARLQSIEGRLSVGSGVLESFDGLDSLRRVVGTVFILGTQAENFEGLGALEEIGGDLYIEQNSRLASLVGLASLARVGGEISIDCNSAQLAAEDVASLEEQLGRPIAFQAAGQSCEGGPEGEGEGESTGEGEGEGE